MGQEPRPEAVAIGLAELIVAVRDELEKADAARLDRADDALLELREVELELQFEVRRTRPGRGGLDFRVLSAGAPAPARAADAPPETQRLRVLYGPAFKLVELEEGDPDGLPDWLRSPVPGPGLRPEAPSRLSIDDDLADLPGAEYPAPYHPGTDDGAPDHHRTDDDVAGHRTADARAPNDYERTANGAADNRAGDDQVVADHWLADNGAAKYRAGDDRGVASHRATDAQAAAPYQRADHGAADQRDGVRGGEGWSAEQGVAGYPETEVRGTGSPGAG